MMARVSNSETLTFPNISVPGAFLPLFYIPPMLTPWEWAHKNIALPKGSAYSNTGNFIGHAFQKEPLNSILYFDRIKFCACEQFGKSLLTEILLGWVIEYMPMNTLICYAKQATVENVFSDRIKPFIEQNPAISKYCTGNNDDMTKEKIKLKNMIIRMASSQVKTDIASFASGFIIASEVCKYRDTDYDVIRLLRGRQQSYGLSGLKKEILESSPEEVSDPLHKEMFKPGVLNLEPYFSCPVCGYYQAHELEQIKEIPNEKNECDHNPERIRRDSAARYECKNCGNDIDEKSRFDAYKIIKWRTRDGVEYENGKMSNLKPLPSEIAFTWNRLIDFTVPFSEMLARFFESSRAGNPIVLKTFLNSDVAQFFQPQSEERSSSWLFSKCLPYKISEDTIPDGVVIVLCGVDTQDNGFYFVTRGFGIGKESWLLDCDFIPCMKSSESVETIEHIVKARLAKKQYESRDGRKLEIYFGLIDRGGHRASYVDHLCRTILWAQAYIGSTDKNAPLIKENKGVYFGNKRNLSRIVSSDSLQDNWHLPEDIPVEYTRQFVKQYEKEEIDRHGNTVIRWYEGANDHFRDCENMIQGAVVLMELDKMLYDSDQLENIRHEQVPKPAGSEDVTQNIEQSNNFLAGINERWNRRGGF